MNLKTRLGRDIPIIISLPIRNKELFLIDFICWLKVMGSVFMSILWDRMLLEGSRGENTRKYLLPFDKA